MTGQHRRHLAIAQERSNAFQRLFDRRQCVEVWVPQRRPRQMLPFNPKLCRNGTWGTKGIKEGETSSVSLSPDSMRQSFWDSLIVAAAKHASCKYLLTEDLQDGQSLDDLVVVDPFKHAPATLGFQR